MSFWEEVWYNVGISWAGLVSVLLATLVMYLVLVIILELAGPALSASPSSLSVAVSLLLAALTARAMLGNTPTLLGGITALVTLLLLESLFGRIREAMPGPARLSRRRAAVVVIDGEVDRAQLRARHMRESQLRSRLRAQGLRSLDEAAAVILEIRGSLTVIREGEQIDRQLLVDVDGADAIPARLARD